MTITDEERNERINDCRNLYLKYEGKQHELIEAEMRAMGHVDFHRRILHARFERGRWTAGWIGKYGFDSLVRARRDKARLALMRESFGRNDEERDETPIDAGETDEYGAEVDTSTPRPGVSAVPAPREMPDFPEFQAWLKQVSPTMEWEWKHQVYIYKRLRRVFYNECNRLMIFVPPRHGKSELVTVRYAAWCLKQDPALNVIIAGYNQRLSNRFSRKIRRVIADDIWLQSGKIENEISDGPAKTARDRSDVVAPTRCPAPNENSGSANSQLSSINSPLTTRRANSEAEWETPQGGGVRAVGVGGGVTGFGAGLIIIDDPVKSRAEAESQTYRDNVWDWFNDDVYTRLEPNGKIILIQTRWHEDDLAGRLLREAKEEGGEQWEVVDLPALAEPGNAGSLARNEHEVRSDTDRSANIESTPERPASEARIAGKAARVPTEDPLGRASGEALCPERYDEVALDRLKRKLGSYSFAALYQQRPVPAEGGLFKREWFKNIVSFAPPHLRWNRGYDLGFTSGASADYTASFRTAFDREGNLYIDGGFRRQIEYPEQRRYILGRITAEHNTAHGIELSANGHAVIQDLRREPKALGRAFRGIKVTGTKVSRAVAWIALAEEGRIRLVRGAWNAAFIDEACSFPSGTHDDQIDAVSIAVAMSRQARGKLHTFN